VADWRGHNLLVEVITCEAAPSLLAEWGQSIADPSRSAMSAILSRVEEAVSRQAGRQAGMWHAMRCMRMLRCAGRLVGAARRGRAGMAWAGGWSVHRPFIGCHSPRDLLCQRPNAWP